MFTFLLVQGTYSFNRLLGPFFPFVFSTILAYRFSEPALSGFGALQLRASACGWSVSFEVF